MDASISKHQTLSSGWLLVKVLFDKHDRSRQHGVDTTIKSKKNGVGDELAKDLNLEMGNQKCMCPFFGSTLQKPLLR